MAAWERDNAHAHMQCHDVVCVPDYSPRLHAVRGPVHCIDRDFQFPGQRSQRHHGCRTDSSNAG